jgi:hypothetical protein
MPRYDVGLPYHRGKTRWEDATDFNYRSGVLELRLFFSQLSNHDIRAIKNGPCTFAITVLDDILFFLFEFGQACPWSDNSYSIHLVSEDERTIPPELQPGEGALLTIILVSSEDGIIQALRQIWLGHDFSQALYNAIREQARKPFDASLHDKRIARIYQRYPSTQALLQRSRISCEVASNHH